MNCFDIPSNKDMCVCVRVCVCVCVLPRLIPTVAIGLSCGSCSPDNGPKMSTLPRSSRNLLLVEAPGDCDFI
jgi:hypothetical protein